MSKTVKDLSIVELKALKCDHFENIQASQNSIMAINAELQERTKAEVVEEVKDEQN